ncbi:protein of unknown function [Paenibacillus alvei]|uniref:Uncharacterized protein n=1 Tax=Paenibacillus alvei TaxID=44250 RepID=A0A383RAF5_PAEAL|nr:protein of unknown function [Paenibacillus alvei]
MAKRRRNTLSLFNACRSKRLSKKLYELKVKLNQVNLDDREELHVYDIVSRSDNHLFIVE